VRQYGRPQAGRADAVDGRCAWRRLAQEAGFPDGVINVVPGYGPTAGAALSGHMGRGQDRLHRRRQHRPRSSWKRPRAAISKRVSLELGGKKPQQSSSPTPTWTRPSKAPTSGLFFNQGQCLLRPAAGLFVEEKVHDQFIEKGAEKKPKSQKVGDPFDPETTQGATGVAGTVRPQLWVTSTRAKKGRREADGPAAKRVGGRGYFHRTDGLHGRKRRNEDR